jgi:RNase P subunit RPR2
MTTREKVSQQLVLFLTFSDRKVLLLTGTHQYRKHILALSTIFDCYRSPSTVLFRINHARNADDFLAPIIGKSGMAPRVKTGRPMNRVLACMSGGSTRRIPKKVSRYAQHVPHEYLMRIFCDKCRTTRWAELNKPYPGPTALTKAEAGEYTAKCLKCGYEAMDNYNWYT